MSEPSLANDVEGGQDGVEPKRIQDDTDVTNESDSLAESPKSSPQGPYNVQHQAASSRRKGWKLTIGLLVLLGLIGAAIGATVGLINRNENDESNKSLAVDVDEESPNQDVPNEQEDTDDEVVREEQTPTDSDAPANDLCVDAIELSWPTSGGITATGTTAQSTNENVEFTLFDGVVDQNRIMCQQQSNQGVWYIVKGRGRGILASTCNSEAQAPILVYEGSDCASLKCVVNYKTDCDTRSWFGELHATYYIYVMGSGDASAPTYFSLELTELSTPVNDSCPGAVEMELDTAMEVSTVSATAEFANGFSLLDWEGNVLPGVYFTVTGTGGVMKAFSACDSQYSPRIYVYEDGCDTTNTVGEKVICEPDSAAYWDSVEGQTYHILFQSANPEPAQLLITEDKPDINDLCLGAIGPLELGSVTEGDTSIGRETPGFRQRRGLYTIAPPGLYYTVVGTGNKMQVFSPCDMTNYQGSILNVFSGTCFQRSYIVDGISSMCEPDSSFTWDTEAGEMYYIYVESYFNAGPFSFNVLEVGV